MELGRTLNPVTVILINGAEDTKKQDEDHVKMESEAEGMQLQAREYYKWPGAIRS